MGDITLRFILGRILRWRVLGLIMFLFIVIYPLIIWGKLPTRLALQFSLSGTPINDVNKGFAYGIFVYLAIILLGTNLFFDIRSIKTMFRGTENKTRWYIYLPISDVFYVFLTYVVYNTLQFNINQVNTFALWKFFLFWGLPVGIISLLNSRMSKKSDNSSHDVEEHINTDLGKCIYHDKQDNLYLRILCGVVILPIISTLFFSTGNKAIVLDTVVLFAGILIFVAARMDFFIYEHAIVIKIGMPKLYRRKKIPINTIKEVHPESFKPLEDFMGWGIRQRADGTHGYFMKGNRGLFILTETSKWLLGFNNPEEAAEIVRKQIKVPVE